MMNNNLVIKKVLAEAGLNENCINIYLFLLSFGAQPVSVIANKIKIKRSTCYGYIEKLKKDGFVSEDMKDGFSSIRPIKFEHILNRIEEDLYTNYEKKKNQISHLRSIEANFNSPNIKLDKPEVNLFSGDKALRSIYEESLADGNLIRCYYEPHNGSYLLDDNWHTNNRVSKGIYIKVIVPKSNKTKTYYSTDKDYTDIRVIASELFPFNGVTLVTNNKILMFSIMDNVGISIESSYLAQNQAKIFDLIWNLTGDNNE